MQENFAGMPKPILLACKRLPIWEGATVKSAIIFRECRNLIEWVTLCGKIMQVCRFAGYVGNGLLSYRIIVPHIVPQIVVHFSLHP